jgi:PleD family two-component response regulator
VARTGGEEFCLLFPGLDSETACVVAGRPQPHLRVMTC